jgi:hypothetical protein
MEPGEKPLYWVGASKRDLMAMPAAAKTDVKLIERRLKAARTDYEAKYGTIYQRR